MQTVLPFFPENTKLINSCVGFFEKDGTVYYLLYGNPIYCHAKNDVNGFRFALANLVRNERCTIRELSDALGVPRKNIERYAKSYREHGAGYFFGRTETRGQCYKMTPEKLSAIQLDLDSGASIYRSALNHNVSEAAISYHIKKDKLKKKTQTSALVHSSSSLSSPTERNELYVQSGDGLGIAASRTEERLLCAMGLPPAPVQFESCQCIPFGGVMLLLPFLLECGLMSYRNHYSQRQRGYYNYDSLLIIIAFLYLCRIKNFEQTKHHSAGEFGKIVGSDRIPEVKKLRGMVSELTSQKCCDQWAASLSENWMANEAPQLYYIDGHVQVYHGYLANLGKKHVSRQRLCLPGVMEFWVNASDGRPYFYIAADVNEKMSEMLTAEIIPELIRLHHVSHQQRERMEANPDEPLFTLVFDREAYSPHFFAQLWEKHRIAVITYRKNVKDKWDESLFEEYTVPTTMRDETMKLAEQEFCSADGKYPMREVRRLCKDGHQTSIVTTNKILTIIMIASQMFARWVQENFFRYMRLEYDLDKIIQYTTDELDGDIKVVNVEYNNITYKIKREREKLSRRRSKLYEYDQKNPLEESDESENKKWMKKRLVIIEDIQSVEEQIESLVGQRKKIPYKIPISQMPENCRYNQLHKESKMLQNVIKMMCYRAETALANQLAPHYKRAEHEIRALVKSVINTSIDMEVDHEKEQLKITLYSMANQRSNQAVSKICDIVNETNTVYPGTNLRLIYKIAT
ncbi:MAG: hypothetical protein LBU83_05890 [Bacteroidales bacterium]|nr:hypothetical protein [Bacteroidales bacterium]